MNATFLLTLENISFVKHALRDRLPDIGSSHRAEAFAAAAGYRTIAALRSDAKRHDAGCPAVAFADPKKFIARLQTLGYQAGGVTFPGEILRSSEMPQRIWAEYRNSDRAANDIWFRECVSRNIPNVYIKLQTEYAELCWDFISVNRSYEAHIRDDDGRDIVRKIYQQFQALGHPDPGKSEFFGSAFVGSVNRLLPAVARELADKFFTILYEPMWQRSAAQAILKH